MSTTDKDFKVKNGLKVAGTATFDSDIVVGTAPISFDTQTGRLKIQIDGSWSPIAFLGDVPNLTDTIGFMDVGLSIDYDGQPTYIIQGNGVSPSVTSKFVIGGVPSSTSYEMYFDAGSL